VKKEHEAGESCMIWSFIMNIGVISSRGYVHNNGDVTHAYRILDFL
jgi:hypothetical protein